jgi:hypothetical protein
LQFELAVTRFTRGEERLPVVQDLRVRPPTVDARGREVQYVTGIIRLRDYNFQPRPFWYDAPVPYQVRAGRLRRQEFANVEEFLHTLSGQYEHITFRTTRANEAYITLATWTLGSVLVIGVIFPTVLSLLTRAGLGPPPAPAKPKTHERPASPRPAAPKPTVPAGGLSEKDRRDLLELEAAMERKLAEGASSAPAPSGAAKAEAQPAVRKLDGAPADPPPVIAPKPQEPHEYKGEFYPVARPVVKKTG